MTGSAQVDSLVGEERLTAKNLGGLPVRPVADIPPYINLLVYGESGVGKTLLAGSAQAVPEMAPVLFVDIEGGTLTLRNHYPEVDVVRVTNFSDMSDVHKELARGDSPYNTIVLDSLTEIQKFSMYGIMTELMKKEDDKERDPDVPGMREWGKNIEQMRRFVRAFRDLPMNVIFTSLAQQDKNPKTGISQWKPQLSGKLSSEVAAFMDIVLYMYILEVEEEQRRFLLAAQTENHIAKDRTGRLPQVIEEPKMHALHQLLTQAQQAQEE